MTRWTEDDLASFQRNSGRELPPVTKIAVEKANLRQLPAGMKTEAVNKRIAKLEADEKRARAASKKPARRLLTPAEQEARDAQAIAKGALEPAKKRKPKKQPVRPLPLPLNPLKPMHQGGAAFKSRLPHKYHAQATVMDGIRFDSRLEANRYTELMLMAKAGEIAYFLRQVPFHLPGGVRYVVDFMIVRVRRPMVVVQGVDNGVTITFEDCKGHQTQDSTNKIKQVRALYGVEIQLVKKARKLRS
jgi:hypothetical protein